MDPAPSLCHGGPDYDWTHFNDADFVSEDENPEDLPDDPKGREILPVFFYDYV